MSLRSAVAAAAILAVVAAGALYVELSGGFPSIRAPPSGAPTHPWQGGGGPPQNQTPPPPPPPSSQPPQSGGGGGGPPQNQTPPPPPPQRASLTDVFDLSAVSRYSYRVTTTSGGGTSERDLYYEVSEEAVGSVPCWKHVMWYEGEGGVVRYTVWLSQSDLSCVKATVVMPGHPLTEVACEGSSTGLPGHQPGMEIFLDGTETVTVPVGTFTCRVYLAEQGDTSVRWWVADGVPVPVRWEATAPDASTVGVLTSYEG